MGQLPATRSIRRQPIRRGAAATEFAVLLPLLVMLCLTSLDLGRFSYTYLALGNAGRVGAEVGATRSYSDATAPVRRMEMDRAVREDLATAGGLDPNQAVVDVDVTSDSGLHRFTITATYPFFTVVSWPGIPRPLEMERIISFRRFR